MIFPLSRPQKDLNEDELAKYAGCNLFTQTPEIRNWLVEVKPGEAFTIGSYAYLDGARHVQVSLAMDAIIKGVMDKREQVSLAYLCSPTDCFVIPDKARAASIHHRQSSPLIQRLLRTFGKFSDNAQPEVITEKNKSYSLCDGIVVAQGPNYALAKRIQHWRAMLARER